MCYQGAVEHYLIDKRPTDGKLGIRKGMRFSILNDVCIRVLLCSHALFYLLQLITHYYNESDGIITKLKVNVMEFDSSQQESFGFEDDTSAAADASDQPLLADPMSLLDKIEVSPAEFEIGAELGSGEFGVCNNCLNFISFLMFLMCARPCNAGHGSAGEMVR